MTVVPYERLPDRADALQVAADFAKAVASTDFVPDSLRGNPAAIAAAILYGDEVGIPPMQALAKIAVINGRPTLAAETQRALILRAGHALWIEESTLTRCTVAGRRRDSDEVSRVTWTLDDAKRAGIAGKQPWRNYPRQMLLARASAELARTIFADAIGGLAAVEELDGGELAAAGNVGTDPPFPSEPTTRRRRRAVSSPDTSSTNTAAVEPDLPPLPDEDDDQEGGAGVREPRRPTPPDDADALAAEIEHVEQEAAEPDPMTDAQRAKMMALFREQGFTERAHRLAFTNAMLGRRIQSSTDLSRDEASKLIDILEDQSRRIQPVVDDDD